MPPTPFRKVKHNNSLLCQTITDAWPSTTKSFNRKVSMAGTTNVFKPSIPSTPSTDGTCGGCGTYSYIGGK